MTNYYVDNTVSSDTSPQLLEITPTAVYVRKNIEELTETVDDIKRTYYRYTESKIAKDVYIEQLAEDNAHLTTTTAAMGEVVAKERFENMQKSRVISELGQTVATLRFDVLSLKSAIDVHSTEGGDV